MIHKFEILQKKIFTKENLNPLLAFWKFKCKKIVFTNGCFDILHRGHIEYLAKASDLGQVLIIGLNSDASVKRLKGENRPIQDEYSRALQLASLLFVDAVVIFEEDTPYKLIQQVEPDILVKGGDYRPESIVGYDLVTAKGGKVETINFVDGYSTSSILKKINS
ncbi:MAG: D-beta-D-heptose 1-phosphate adenosyltransferase [Bacteroidetes bacterium RIFOXYA12_FULL_35_11]|nr:MAG: D-beta-D-heptose 1-phosphate adenosyltransferase [Bacteroidetes bacterium GWF2_35_48]OFY75887.1 MAG: D-beta-D-heptose 1-phosphate adenosyltransferase [Bacteroidetes bacterium RIFOXYA12_FULL_35_11]OFY99375.1 MAG: D-beta-D-heptose 1-phosphate adenosyltransferase [Bacteroidetes bacterium RIFOXYC12_FULL_35_7]HBX52149.1 D-glycero-beta-D-manno-heptose 1-phosphate adenylyltransferase [Bacteroidales bacterium]